MPMDLSFYYAAVPAVILVGLAKGGMGDALSLIGLPFLALVVSPVQAAAILLPILVFMDMISLVIWRKHGDWATLKIMLPGAVFGVALGWATSALVPGNVLRVVIGAVTILFCLRYFWNNFGPGAGRVVPPHGQRPLLATIWGTFSATGSRVVLAGREQSNIIKCLGWSDRSQPESGGGHQCSRLTTILAGDCPVRPAWSRGSDRARETFPPRAA